MKKRLLRLSKRILILSLCTCLVSGSVIQKYKITANATSIVLGGVTYSIGEVMAWLGATVLGITGTAYVASDDYSELIEIGYEAAKAMDAELDNAQDWLFATMDKDGKAYFYANNYFDAIQSCDVASIIETSAELSNDFAIFATDTLWDIVVDYASVLETKIALGEENPVSQALNIPAEAISDNLYYTGQIPTNSSGQYVYKAITYGYENENYYKCILSGTGNSRIGAYINHDNNGGRLQYWGPKLCVDTYLLYEGSWRLVESSTSKGDAPAQLGYCCNFPFFATSQQALDYYESCIKDGIINYPKTYQIADWSDNPQHGDVRDVITQNPALVNDYVSGMSDAFGTSFEGQITAGEYPDVIDGSIGAIPFDKPDVITPSYVGELDVPWAPDLPSVAFPGIADTDLPWSNVWDGTNVGNPDIPSTGGTDTEESDDTVSEEVIRGSDPFGINTLFGILVLLIMILLMLLIIFLSCLAFIIMIFRIEPTTGFLPPEMVQGFEYLKTLEIPGFGMSVYEFFMALIYIILIFTVVGILRKNIDKIRFPRKGRLK